MRSIRGVVDALRGWPARAGKRVTTWCGTRPIRVTLVVAVMQATLVGVSWLGAVVFTMPGKDGAAPATTLPRWDAFWLILAAVTTFIYWQLIVAVTRTAIGVYRRYR